MMTVIVLVALIVSFATLLAYVAARPDTFRVERTTVIEAAPEQIFPYLQDFRKFTEWSPYEHLDPEMSRTYSGPKKGKGAVYEWSGRGKAGKGRMEIAHVSPRHMVVMRLDIIKPFESQNIVEFTMSPEEASTSVTWAMRGANPYVAKLVQVFVKMDQLVGKDFERGLAKLKAIVEQQSSESMPRIAIAR
jgi:uncharacterized protein YndB with AHSA1/START domain